MQLLKKHKTTIILLTLVAVLVGYTFWYDSSDKKAQKQKQDGQEAVFENLQKDKIKKITVEDSQGEVVLEKDGDVWKIVYAEDEKYSIKQTYLKSAFDVLEEISKADIIGRNKEKHEDFLVTEETAAKVALYEDGADPVFKVYLGVTGPLYPSQFIRMSGSDNVLLVKHDLDSLFRKGKSEWRDKELFNLSITDAKELSFEFFFDSKKWDKKEYTLERKDNQWSLKSPVEAEADQSVADSLFNTVANLTAIDFASKEESEDLESLGLGEQFETLKVFVKLNDESEKILTVGIGDDSTYYAKTGEKEIIYKVGRGVEIFTRQDLTKLKKKD